MQQGTKPSMLQYCNTKFQIHFGICSGDKSQKAQQTIKDAELIKNFKELDQLPEDEKKSILKVINALIRDFNARQAYAM